MTDMLLRWRYEMKRYPDSDEDKPVDPPPGFVSQIMETLGWKASDVTQTQSTKRKRDNFIFGGRRRQSKMGIDGNPSPGEVTDAEAGAPESPFLSTKSPLHASNRPFP